MRTTTIRMSDEDAEALDAIARVEGVAVSNIIRRAIQEEIAAKRKDAAFQERLKVSLERDKEILKRLAK